MKKIISSFSAAAAAALFAVPVLAGGVSGVFNEASAGLEAAAPAEPAIPVPPGSGGVKVPKHAPSPAQALEISRHNAALGGGRSALEKASPAEPRFRPYADYEKIGYLIMNGDFEYASLPAKLAMASILPADAELVIVLEKEGAADKEYLLSKYTAVIPKERIRVVALKKSTHSAYGFNSAFWARDAMPVPVLDGNGKLTLIDARYYHGFEGDKEISLLFGAGYEKHEYSFEGGNLQANTKGDCVIVDNKLHKDIPDGVFSGFYGCKRLIRLPFVDGIGHVDERARFVNDSTLLTDTPQYKDLLEAKGFTVHMLPRPRKPYGTYVNSLISGDRVAMPTFDEETDAVAMAVYGRLGLKAVGGDSVALSTQGLGSLHCITMTYPKVPAAALLKAMNADEI